MAINSRVAAFRAGDEAAFEFVQSGEQPEAILAGFARGFTTAAEAALDRAITEAQVPRPLRPAFAAGFRHGLPMAASEHLAGLASARGREGDEAAHLRMDATWRMHARTAEAALAVEDARDATFQALRDWVVAEAEVAMQSAPHEDDIVEGIVDRVAAAVKRRPAVLDLLSRLVTSEHNDDAGRARDAIAGLLAEAIEARQLLLP